MANVQPLSHDFSQPTESEPTFALTSAPQSKRQDGSSGGNLTARTSSAGNSLSSRSMDCLKEATTAEQWKNVRTLPTWVQRREEEDDDALIRIPPQVHRRLPQRSVYDSEREKTPVTISPPGQHSSSRWKSYLEGSAYPPPNSSQSEKVDTDWLAEQGDLDSPWLANNREAGNEGDGSGEDGEALFISTKKRKRWYKRIHIVLLNNPMVPLTLRATIFILSLLALALAGSIFHLSRVYDFSQKPSTIMAIIVDAIALVYLIYITYDEYSGKPLGLRSPKAKIRLIMFDLLFIIFDSANLSLAFDTLYDTRWSCRSSESAEDFTAQSNVGPSQTDRVVDPICDRQRALSAFLFLALCAWVATFAISIFRVVERVSSRSGP